MKQLSGKSIGIWRITPSNLRPCIEGIVYNLEAGSDHVFFLDQSTVQPRTTGRRRGISVHQSGLVSAASVHRPASRVWVRSGKHFCPGMVLQENDPPGKADLPVPRDPSAGAKGSDIDWEAKAPGIDTPFAEVESLYAFHLAGRKRPMDDYILDLHTHRGKRSGNCLENFAMEGAYIENENVDFLRPEYREIYVTLKQELDLYRNKGLKEQQATMAPQEVGLPSRRPHPVAVLNGHGPNKKSSACQAENGGIQKAGPYRWRSCLQRPVHLRRSQVDQQPEIHLRPTGVGRKAESA